VKVLKKHTIAGIEATIDNVATKQLVFVK